MIKINYPHSSVDEKNKFEKDYISHLVTNEMKSEFKKFLKDDIFIKSDIKCLNDLLLAPFEELLKIYNIYMDEYPFIEGKKKRNREEYDGKKYELFFNYDKDKIDKKKPTITKKQKKISNFFKKYSKKLNLKTCYFCNIDYINTFDNRGEYDCYLKFLNTAHKNELTQINQITDEDAERIVKERDNGEIKDIKQLGFSSNPAKVRNIEKLVFKEKIVNHYTLDHFLPKSDCPLLALSLYNFVPSCYSCNSSFKNSKILPKEYLSPTSQKFSVDKNIKFKLFFANKINKNNILLSIQHDKKYMDYLDTFKLKGRYSFHKDEALTLIEKQEKYSETRLNEIAKILEISPSQVKKDIFGKELFSGYLQDKSFTKMKRDVARNIGIRGVKDD